MAKYDKLTVGEKLSETTYYHVAKIDKTTKRVQLTTDQGTNVVVDAAYVDGLMTSASQVEKEESMTRTEIAELILSNKNIVMTVNFNKQVKEADVVKEVIEAQQNSTPREFEKKVKAAVKGVLAGVERTLVGYHSSGKDEFGRVHFIDMNLERKISSTGYDSRLRQVDPRTVNWVILKGVKYIAR